MRKLFILSLLLLFALCGVSQQYKYEKESRIKEDAVPENAINFVDSMGFNSRIKWYKEIAYDRTSIEAKTKSKGKRYSIEFSDDGTFEDVEIEIRSSEIPTDTYFLIKKHLQSKYEKYSIEKVQIQYLGDKALILHFFQEEIPANQIEINYEIVISTKVDGSFVMFEYLFSESGEAIKSLQVKLKKSDNIEY